MASRRGSSAYTCRGCGAVFRNFQQLGGHLSKGYLCGGVNTEHSRNLDETNASVTNNQQIGVTGGSAIVSGDEETSCASCGGDSDENEGAAGAPVPFLALHQLLQRPCKDMAKHTVKPTLMRPGSRASQVDPRRTCKMHEVLRPYQT